MGAVQGIEDAYARLPGLDGNPVFISKVPRAAALERARAVDADISAFGGWRNYLESTK